LDNAETLSNIQILKQVTANPFIEYLNRYKTNIISASDANKLLVLTLNAYPIDLPDNPFEKQQAELVKFAINNGATFLFNISENFVPVALRTLEYLKSLVKQGIFPASFFLRQVVLSYEYDQNSKLTNDDKETLFYDLVKFAIDQNADVNTIMIVDYPILQFVKSSKIFKLLEENGGKCSTFSQNLKKIIEEIDLSEADILDFPKELHKSLISEKKPILKCQNLFIMYG
jgi:hypothetical protein